LGFADVNVKAITFLSCCLFIFQNMAKKCAPVQRTTPLSNIRGLGQIYSRQTVEASGGVTVKALIQRIEPWVTKRDIGRITRFLQVCAANPRAGQRLPSKNKDKEYVVPAYNTHIVEILLDVITGQRGGNSAWLPVLKSVRSQLQQ
jgi:hypothetical protein